MSVFRSAYRPPSILAAAVGFISKEDREFGPRLWMELQARMREWGQVLYNAPRLDPKVQQAKAALVQLRVQVNQLTPGIDDAIQRAKAAGKWNPEWPQSAQALARMAENQDWNDEPGLGVWPLGIVIVVALAGFVLVDWLAQAFNVFPPSLALHNALNSFGGGVGAVAVKAGAPLILLVAAAAALWVFVQGKTKTRRRA